MDFCSVEIEPNLYLVYACRDHEGFILMRHLAFSSGLLLNYWLYIHIAAPFYETNNSWFEARALVICTALGWVRVKSKSRCPNVVMLSYGDSHGPRCQKLSSFLICRTSEASKKKKDVWLSPKCYLFNIILILCFHEVDVIQKCIFKITEILSSMSSLMYATSRTSDRITPKAFFFK